MAAGNRFGGDLAAAATTVGGVATTGSSRNRPRALVVSHHLALPSTASAARRSRCRCRRSSSSSATPVLTRAGHPGAAPSPKVPLMVSETVKTERRPAERNVKLVRRWRAIGWIQCARDRLRGDDDDDDDDVEEKHRWLVVGRTVYGMREVDATGCTVPVAARNGAAGRDGGGDESIITGNCAWCKGVGLRPALRRPRSGSSCAWRAAEVEM